MFKSIAFSLSFAVVCVTSIFSSAAAGENSVSAGVNHPLSIVEADVLVGRRKLIMRLKCYAEDLELLHGVEPYEETGKYDNTELQEGTQDHAKYLLEKILIMDAEGEVLEGEVTEIRPFEIPKEGIPAGQLMNYTIGYIFEYTYEEPPEFITMEQRMIADGALLPTELKYIVKQSGADVSYGGSGKIMKPAIPETFQFDWEGVPDKNDDVAVWDKWLEEQREKNLGIESYGSVYSFFYITRREVRQEILIPIASLSTFIDIESEDGRFLEIDEQDALKPKIEALLSAANPVTIDANAVQPKFDRIDFYGLDIRDFAMQAERRKISMANGRVGVIMSYDPGGAPAHVSVTWDMFNSIVRSVDTVVIALGTVRRTQFSKFLENNTYTWSNAEPVNDEAIETVPAEFDLPFWEGFPWLSLLLFVGAIVTFASGRFRDSKAQRFTIAGALTAAALLCVPLVKVDLYAPWSRRMQVSEQKADEVFAALHANLFRAFDYSSESRIYDGLAKSVDGKLLGELYLQLNDSLRIKEQGGAVANITEVNLLKGKLRENGKSFSTAKPGFVYRCKWNLVGDVEHWGHIHERTNVYDASFDVQAIDNQWKITAMKLEDVPQGIVKRRLRKF
ncbi:hypothetical protein [Mariniblastus fucicola]|nr:hypothetical protein [Mariniblastus fucicola]